MSRLLLEDDGNSPLGRMPGPGRVVTLPLVSQRAEDVVTRAGGDRTLLGLALLGAGGVWLVGEMGPFHVAGRTLESVALVCIGAGLIVTRRSGGRVWPILVGGILAISLLGNSATANFRNRFGSDIGARTIVPTVLPPKASYRTALGALTLDLTQASFPAGVRQTVRVDVGLGAMRIIVPPSVELWVGAAETVGEVTVLGHRLGGGFGLDESYHDPGWYSDGSAPHLTLQLSGTGGAVRVEYPRQ